jgi:hypothetical protein
MVCTSNNPREMPVIAQRIIHPCRIDDPKLKEALFNAFRARLPQVLDQCGHEAEGETAEFIQGLDEWEKECELLALGVSTTDTGPDRRNKSVHGGTKGRQRDAGLARSADAKDSKDGPSPYAVNVRPIYPIYPIFVSFIGTVQFLSHPGTNQPQRMTPHDGGPFSWVPYVGIHLLKHC